MNDFDYDIVQKKRVARGAFAHVNRKRGKCRLPSDYLTAAQKKEMNGAVKTYNITRPMPLDEFKGMPDDLQREYLRNMQSCGAAATYLIYACLCRMNVKSRLSGERRRKLVKEHITTGGKTLCWTCRKAYGKCSWTEVDYTKKGWPIRFEPVKGWNAIPTKNEKYTSFLVVSCPE